MAGLALAVALVLTVTASPGTAAQSGNPCRASVAKEAAPDRIVIGQTVTITMGVAAKCDALNAPVHAVLAVDNGVAMGGSRIGRLRQAVRAFVAALDMDVSRVGVLSYYGFVDMLTELTRDPAVLDDIGSSFFPRQGNDQDRALRGAHDMIIRGRALTGGDAVTEVIVLLSGSQHQGDEDILRATAQRIKDEGILLVTAGLTGDANFQLLEELATSPEQFYIESEGILYAELMETIVGDTATVRLEGAQFFDRLPENMELVWGSDVPPARVRGDQLQWAWNIWPTEGITITYELEPLALGRQPVSLGASVELRFDRGAPSTLAFPIPVVEVVSPPTETPTPTPTPTVTPSPTLTPVLVPAYLPLAMNRFCKPDPRGADFALVIDVSTSMLERAAEGAPKLQLATLAASRFIDALRLPHDRAAVVAFHGEASLVLDLTGSRDSLQTALSKLFGMVGVGTRIDRGIDNAQRVLLDGGAAAYPGPMPPHWSAADRDKVIILLTDGFAERDTALAAASAARSTGVVIYTIGLGRSIDEDLLVELSGSPGRYKRSADGADLEAIYLEIARDRGCP